MQEELSTRVWKLMVHVAGYFTNMDFVLTRVLAQDGRSEFWC